ncbi:MAG: MaoC family dehydratase N-terminal domain-containing protein [Actinomycetota bacterium]
MAKVDDKQVTMDAADVDRYVGKPVGGGQQKEPVAVNDIRRWAQAMQYPNPLHYEEAVASASPFGRIVAPQSFTVCCDVGHGATPAIVGSIPGSHMIFGGDEWWFYGPRIFPGDHVRMERRFVDYKVSDTKFAGPTMFSRGDTLYSNQRGEQIATQRSTAVRYLAEEARARGFFHQTAPRPEWTPEKIADLEAKKVAWIRAGTGRRRKTWDEVQVGEKLPTRPIGPHTIASFTTEWRAFTMTVWGATSHDDDRHIEEAGWLPEMSRNLDAAEEDPALADGLYHGPSRGHTDEGYANVIGLPRGYGYGASMGAWVLDYAAHWAGDHGFVRHSQIQYRFPPFEGDASLLDAEVVDKREDATLGVHLVTLEFVMSNQDAAVLAKGPVEVQLPHP